MLVVVQLFQHFLGGNSPFPRGFLIGEIVECPLVLGQCVALFLLQHIDVGLDFQPAGNDPLGPEHVAADIASRVDDVVCRIRRNVHQRQIRGRRREADRESASRAMPEVAGHGIRANIAIAVGSQVNKCDVA